MTADDAESARDAVRRRFDERAVDYDESDVHRRLASAVAAFVDLDGVRSVLDAGTGTGLVLRALRARDARTRLTGVDLSPGMLAVARAALPDAELIEGDAAALPVPDASADLVTCVAALHLLPDTAAAIEDWSRVLRPGGRIVTATFAVAPAGAHAPGSPHDRFRTREQLAAAFSRAGFAVRRIEHWAHGEDSALIAEFAPASQS